MLAEVEAARPISQPHLSWGVRESLRLMLPNIKTRPMSTLGKLRHMVSGALSLVQPRPQTLCTLFALNPLTSLALYRVSLYNQIARLCHNQG